MDGGKLFDRSLDLPDGYQVQLMVLPEGSDHVLYRSRVWIGLESETDPMLYRCEIYPEYRRSVDACYSLLLKSASAVIESPAALAAVHELVHDYFEGMAVHA